MYNYKYFKKRTRKWRGGWEAGGGGGGGGVGGVVMKTQHQASTAVLSEKRRSQNPWRFYYMTVEGFVCLKQ